MRKLLIIGAKLGLSAVLIWYAFSKFDISDAVQNLGGLPSSAVLAGLVLLLLQCVLAGWRLEQLIRIAGSDFRFRSALDAVMVGAFFSQTLISFVGGDAMRIWRISRHTIPVGNATRAVLLDRLLGFVGLLLLIVIGLPVLFSLITDPRLHLAILLLLAGATAGCIMLIAMKSMPLRFRKYRIFAFLVDLSNTTRAVLSRSSLLWPLLVVSLLIQAVNVAVIYVLARGLGVDISFLYCLALVPPVLFLSMMPISFAGWGVRESAMIAAFGAVGVAHTDSLAISIAYGLGLVVVSLPGGILWLLSRRKSQPAGAPIESN